WHSAQKSSACHQGGFSNRKEKFEKEGCETLLGRIKSGQTAMERGMKWLANEGLGENHETNVKAMRAALELLNAEFYYYSKMGCEADIENLASWGFDELIPVEKR